MADNLKYRRVKGTRDILPGESYQWQYVEGKIAEILEQAGYREIRTPVFEVTELFARGVGADTDVVSKEMYTFTDKGGNSLTLRPELTASVMRAYIQNNMNQLAPVTKVYYIDSLFRQERPQKGRLRQFHQFGFELVGCEQPEADAEVIEIVYRIYKALGIKDLEVKLNSIGSRESRREYLEVLRKALAPHRDKLCNTCQERYEKNILRLFDCKRESCQAVLDEHAPSILDHLSPEDQQHFEELRRLLDISRIPYRIDPKLVRGLDYYTRTTFEISSPLLGSQDAICGGGRYDLLVEDLGGGPTPAVGVASGMERLLMVLEALDALPQEESHPLYLVSLGDRARLLAFQLMTEFRRKGIAAEMDFLRRSMKAQMRDAGKKSARWVIIVGDNEIERGVLILKSMAASSQQEIALDEALEKILALLQE